MEKNPTRSEVRLRIVFAMVGCLIFAALLWTFSERMWGLRLPTDKVMFPDMIVVGEGNMLIGLALLAGAITTMVYGYQQCRLLRHLDASGGGA